MNIKRQKALLTATAIIVLTCLTVQGTKAAASKKQPNVILILADDKY